MAELKKTSIYLDADLDAALAQRAAEDGTTKAELIRTALAGAVARPKRPRISVGSIKGGPRGDIGRDHDRLVKEGLEAEYLRQRDDWLSRQR